MKKIEKIVAIQGDPLHLINKKTDTTLLLALEAQRRNYKIYYYQTKNLTFSFKSRVSPNVLPRQNRITTKKSWNILNEGSMERYGPTEHRWTIFKNFQP